MFYTEALADHLKGPSHPPLWGDPAHAPVWGFSGFQYNSLLDIFLHCLGWLSTDGTLDSFFGTSDAEGIDEGQIQLGGVRQHHLSMKSMRLSFDSIHMSVQLIQFRFLVQHMSVVLGCSSCSVYSWLMSTYTTFPTRAV